MLTLPDFNRLRIFYHVIKHGNPTAAARALFVTHSAVSQQIRKLEEELGAVLFVRTNRRWQPTDAAGRLYRSIEGFIEELGGAVAAIGRGASGPSGLLRIGAPVEFGVRAVAPLIAGFHEEYPDVRFDVTLGVPETLVPAVNDGRLDIAFCDNGALFRRNPALECRPVIREQLVLVCSRKYYRSAIAGEHTLQRLAGASYIEYVENAAPLRWWFGHHFRRVPHAFHIVVRVENVRAVLSFVERHLGLALLPDSMVAPGLRARRLVQITTTRKELLNEIDLIRLRKRNASIAEDAFVAAVARHRW